MLACCASRLFGDTVTGFLDCNASQWIMRAHETACSQKGVRWSVTATVRMVGVRCGCALVAARLQKFRQLHKIGTIRGNQGSLQPAACASCNQSLAQINEAPGELRLVKASGYIYMHFCATDRSTGHLSTYSRKDSGLDDFLDEHARRRNGRWIYQSKKSK